LGRYDSPGEIVIGLVENEYKMLGKPEDFEVSQKVAKVKAALVQKPQETRAIAEAVEMTEKETQKYLKRLVDDGEITRSGHGTRGHPYFYSSFLPY
jgi:DNA-binding MarR family transcriptional regulator